MTKDQIIKQLQDKWIKQGSGWKEYDRAMEVLCKGQMSAEEKIFRINVVNEYLNIRGGGYSVM